MKISRSNLVVLATAGVLCTCGIGVALADCTPTGGTGTKASCCTDASGSSCVDYASSGSGDNIKYKFVKTWDASYSCCSQPGGAYQCGFGC